jgi:cytochrome c5
MTYRTPLACLGIVLVTQPAGAPKLGDKAAWAPRIAKGNDALLSSVKNGLNAKYMVEQGS